VDALAGDTSQTAASVVTIVGQTDPGASVALTDQNLRVVADGRGVFQMPGVALALGANALQLAVTDAGGLSANVASPLTRVAQTQADAVLDWTLTALNSIQRDVSEPTVATRILAIQGLAVYDTLAAIQGTPAFLVQRTDGAGADAQAAAAQAAYTVLHHFFPGQRSALDTALQTSLAAVANGDAKTAGIALGRSIALSVIAIRANDGADMMTMTDEGGNALGQWRPTGPMYAVAEEPGWGSVTPFALSSGDQFRAPPPPALDSAEYAAAVAEVARLGSASSTSRSTDQTEQAHFWADGKGSYTPPGHWVQIATQIAQSQGNSLSANARMMAQLTVALADAAIACWDTKYAYDYWRPVTAIQLADQDGNAATNVDANWTPLLITPSHPSYVSGHSTFSAAGAGILASIFGDNVSFTTSSPTLLGVTRSYTSFSQASAEAGLSRIYGGIHYGFDNAQGNTIGSQVAAAVLARFALTEDLQAPDVVLQAVPAATNTNPTLRGQVLDNLSGVASATISIDGGTRVALTLAADGSFSFTPALALDGSADGDHSYSIVAVDRAGNTSAALFGVFALDTTGPVLTLSSVADDAALSGAVRLTGIALGTGSAITQLSYRFNDSGPVYRVTPDAGTGAYDAALVYANLGYGAHVLTVEARDAAGNVATLTRNVRVDTLAPFNVAALTPADGFTDVGLTQRPLVTFSREVNLATLTADSFYATGPGGAKLAATIVPGGNGTWAWLFFDAPMPGSSQITVTVDGGLIRAAADGVFLDADGDGQAGGLRQTVFTTVGQTAVTGTKIIGRVVDPGPDLEPMTFDDIRRGADGVIHTADDQFLLPIAHAKVFILGRENAFVYTDDNGFFELDNVPAGTVKVAIDGRTATNAPQGVFFPEMVMNAELIAGTTNTLMGSMGSPAERVANADRSEVYLPRVANVVMQAVSDTQTTVITASDPAAAPGLTDEQRAQLTLTVAPGSAIGEDGQPLTGVQVGVATVPPELVRDMLPPGVLQHTFDITIQAPGVSAFTEPVAITMPNVFGAAPGTKVNILSFDHTTGLLVINGTGTVSADGLTVVSDEGSGVRAPGWHGVAPPGSPTDGPDNPPPQEPPPCISAKNAWDIIVDLSTAVAACAAELAGVRQAFYTALSIADKARELISQVQTVYDEAQKPGVSAAELAGYLKIVGNAKGIIVAAVEGVQRAANKPRQIAKCIEAILAGLDNICGRVQSQGDQCNTTLIKTVCIGIAAAKATLAQVNALIEAAEGSVRKLGLALVCSLIDKLGTLIGAAANAQPQGSMLMAPMALNLEDGSAARADGEPLDIAEIRRVCEQIIADLNAQSGDMQTVQDFVVAFAAMADDARQLDEDTAKIYSSFVSGLPANAFYLIRSEGLEMRGRTDGNGRLDVFLPPDADYTLQIYDATSNRIAQVVSHSAPSGSPTRIPALAFASLGLTSLPLDGDGMRVIPAFMLPDGLGGILDTDGDGLADVAEDVIGTRIDLTDSDRDALTDLAEVQQGLNPLDGRLAATGVVGQVALQGTAKAVAVVASVDGQSRSNVLVATGSHGLAIVEATSADRPRLLAEIDLSGDSQDVVGDDARGLAAVAAGDTGLHLLDIANLGAPTLVQTVAFNGPVGHLALRDGMVYATVGADLAIVDIETGEIRTTQSVGGAALIGLSLDGDVLYTLDAANMLRSFSVIGDTFTALDTLTLDEGGGGLFVGGGVAYVGRGDSFAQGFQTVNTQDPANLVLISGIDSVGIAAQAMAANGSGWLVSVGNLVVGAGQAGYALDLVDVKDPTDTGKSLTRYTLPAAPRDLALANGLAFVADGTGGLQIVNYSSADRAGVAPTVSMAVSVIDADPNTDGVQVQEGQTLRIVPSVSDDTQVARVELLVNGQVVSNDPDFPFELFAAIPAIAIGGNTVTVQLRATDTG
ncbi:MAG: phosphatase PAP2 family protein, partial [Burkholderiaceae bacterium]|nr:phosphatase PAP2 family protein [Burkholderiaceae bacterium]